MPLGGGEETSGYKGYGLALLVEIFCGILSGSAWGPHIRRWKVQDEIANLGQCFIAIDPGAFTEDFNGRMQVGVDLLTPSNSLRITFSVKSLLDTCRGLDPVNPDLPVIVPGDRSVLSYPSYDMSLNNYLSVSLT